MPDHPLDEPTIVYDFDPNNLPPEYLQAIGKVVAASAQTEFILQKLIAGLLGIDNVQSVALGAHLTFPLKDHIIRTLAELSAPSLQELDKLDDLLDAVKDALDKRNTIVHNSFAIHPNGQVFSYRVKARGSLQAELKPVTFEEMEKDAALVYKVGMDIFSYMVLKGLLPAHRTSVPRATPNRGKKARQDRKDGVSR